MRVPAVELRVGLQRELAEAFARVEASGNYVLGEEVAAFEREFAAYCGVRYCVGVGSGTEALALILRACRVGPGDEVLVPAYRAVATWMAVSAIGASPVGVDVDERSYNLDVEAVEGAITDRTRAIVAVHLFGQPADIDRVAALAAEHGLVVLEDAAQAHGARYRSRVVGGLAHAAAFSFYPTKNLGALGDAGAVTTNDPEIADRVRMLRTYGWRHGRVSEVKGQNSRLDELQAALLRVKLGHLDDWNTHRRSLADRYRLGFADLAGAALPHVSPWAEPVWHQFVVGIDHRASVREMLNERGVGTLVHYDPLPHLTPAYRADAFSAGDFPVAERLAGRALSMPIYPQLAAGDCEHAIRSLHAAQDQAAG